MAITIKQLEAFVWVADLKSFRRAADRLSTTQPNISARIAALESHLRFPLMDRDAGSVRLTPKGRDILRHARAVLASMDDLLDASKNTDLIDGVLRLGVTEMIVQTWLRDFLLALKATFPKLKVELTVDMSVALEGLLVDRQIDLALQNAPFSNVMSGNVDLGNYEQCWISSPDFFDDFSDISVTKIAEFPILTHARGTRTFNEIDTHFRNKSNATPQIVPSSNLAACQQMAADAMGIAALPKAMVDAQLRDGSLVVVPYGWVPESLHFWARFDDDRASPTIKTAARIAADISKASSA